MRIAFSRTNPNNTPLRPQYNLYQRLVAIERRNPEGRHRENLPPELQHLHTVSLSPGFLDPAELKAPRAKLDRAFAGDRLRAAGTLALEMEERARWLIGRAETTQEEETPKRRGQPATHRIHAVLPLDLGGEATDTVAIVSLLSDRLRTHGSHTYAHHLGHVSIEVRGNHTTIGRSFMTYASIGREVLDLAHPETSDYAPGSVHGRDLISLFELRDMATFVENNANSGLPQQRYGSHVLHASAAVAPAA